MLHRAIWQKLTNISEVLAASIIRAMTAFWDVLCGLVEVYR
jgi:hypothetical protein